MINIESEQVYYYMSLDFLIIIMHYFKRYTVLKGKKV